MFKFYFALTIIFGFIFAAADGEAKQEHVIRGRTMGTTYSVKVVTADDEGISGVKGKIDKRLKEINRSMSTYQKDSEISRFNRFKEVGQKFKISNDFFRVMRAGQKIHRLSNGAWDGTVTPLVDLWGFGRSGRQDKVPPNSEIAALLPDIGFANIDVLNPGFLAKKRAAVTIDLSSIAKGYGVDEVAALLRNLGYMDYLVEIGGEIFAAGHRKDNTRWRIGINRPRADAAFDAVYKVVALRDQGFATSGDYRNFFEVDGTRYSHVIDPRSGYPVSNGVVGVSIVADTCTFADGLATAVMVMGVEKGLELIDRLDGVEGLIVVEQTDGTLVDYDSKGFEVIN
ncbi:MAG: FAD:protein FMN transferase [Desulfobacterales bacterium]